MPSPTASHPGPAAGKCLIVGLLFIILIATAGCGASSAGAWTSLTERSSTYNFQAVSFDVESFTLAGLLKGRAGDSSELIVYLEGDGRGVIRGKVTHDPTPNRAMGFELAKSDPAPAVLYLARVGQFQPDQNGPEYQAYWSHKRLSEEAVVAASQALDQAKALTGAKSIHLVGYSGGGGLALLLAKRRTDVLTVTTVAGLLDINWWVKEKNFQPLTGSLNPAAGAKNLANMPQVHFYGTEDIIIPPAMSSHFKSLAPFNNFNRVAVPTNHWKLWPELWPELLQNQVIPMRASSGSR